MLHAEPFHCSMRVVVPLVLDWLPTATQNDDVAEVSAAIWLTNAGFRDGTEPSVHVLGVARAGGVGIVLGAGEPAAVAPAVAGVAAASDAPAAIPVPAVTNPAMRTASVCRPKRLRISDFDFMDVSLHPSVRGERFAGRVGLKRGPRPD